MLTAIRQDIRAAKERDPAVPSTLQVIFAYPGVHAIWGHRISHWLWNRGARVAARVFAELTRIPARSWVAAYSSTTPPVW
jgi:serine O-acetyltransferase